MMQRFCYRISINAFLIIFLFIFMSPQKVLSQKKVRNIVVFFSFSANIPGYENFLEGFTSTYAKGYEQPDNLMIEYLDLVRTETEEYQRHIIQMYNSKFKENKIDLLITMGPGTYQTLEKFGLEAIKTSPSINIVLDSPDRIFKQKQPNSNSLEIPMKLKCSSMLKAAFDLFPDFKDIYVISGTSNSDKYFTSLIENSIKEFEADYRFTFISGLTIDSTIMIAKKIPEKSLVFVPSFLMDKNNIPFSTPEVLTMLSYNCKGPVFPITDTFLKYKGGIGGFVFSYISLGKETGRISAEMLLGKKPNDIIVDENSFHQYIYDWHELEKWDLLHSKAVPEDSIFYNKDISFFTRYKWHILVLFIFLISQTLLIIYLFILNRRQKIINRQMVENEIIYREMIREDRLTKMTELTASLSHELNQPLTAILYSAQAGKRFLQSGKLDNIMAEEIFNNIVEDDKRAAGIISSVKSLMKLETREFEKVKINALIKETIDIINSEAIRHGIKIILKPVSNSVYVFGDKIQLEQVLLNFIRNAILALENFSRENKMIEVIQEVHKGSVTVKVMDNGPGIDKTIIEKLFKPFVTTREGGFGIGLALCRSIIEKHKGEIWAENLESGGAVFSFKLQTIKND